MMLTSLFTRRRRTLRGHLLYGTGGELHVPAERDLFERISGTLTHDLRNPLNTIGLNVHLAKTALEQSDAELGGMAIEHIDRAKQQMVESVERFRTLVRALYGETVREPVDMTALARGLRERLEPAAADVELTVHDLPRALGDSRLVAALLWSLITSALDAVRAHGGGRVEVGHVPDSEPAVYWVADDGTELTPSESDGVQLWRRSAGASQADPWLELAVRAVARQGGVVSASSRPEGGVIVHFQLDSAGSDGA